VSTTPSTSTDSIAPSGDFPLLEEVVYLDSASFGLTAKPVAARMSDFAAERAGRGTIEFDDDAEKAIFDGARDASARLLNADVNDVAIMSSATEVLCQLAWWRQPQAGTNVVSADHEFPSVTYPWLRVTQQTGAELRLAQLAGKPWEFSLDHLAELVDEQTDVICISHVQYSTGTRLDIVKLQELARSVDALLVLDATQSAGVVPIDVQATGVDVVLSSSYKWLCGAAGAAFCYMRPEVWSGFNPPFVGWRSTVDPTILDPTHIPLAESARRMEYSTPAYTSGIGLQASIEYLLGLGIDNVFAHNSALAGRFIEGVSAIGGEVWTPREEADRSSTVTVAFPGITNFDVVRKLREIGVAPAPRLGAVRFAWHMFNTPEHVDRTIAALERMLAEAGASASA
jgi:selenocysteine lyase/cysteine desulfurase